MTPGSSRHRSQQSPTQMAISVGAHTAIIAVAVVATAHGTPRPVEEHTRIVWPRPYVAPQRPPATPTHTVSGRRPTSIWIDPRIEIRLPTLPSLGAPSVGASDFASGPTLKSDSSPLAGTSSGEAFRADQVEQQASLAPGNAAPAYPEQLRSTGVEGRVVATFIIDTTGHVEPASIHFAQSGNGLFEASVRSALGRMRFIPAQVGGVRVRQLVQMPFVFTLSR